MLNPEGQVIMNHRVLSLIGEGGMGYVFLAEHITLHRKAALKVLNPSISSNPEIKIRFLNEAVTLAQLNHTNIVTLYDFSEKDNNLYLLMEYVEGDPLDIYIEHKHGLIAENECKKIFIQILSGVSYAHKKSIIHRDIKPSNIILKYDGEPKILDFGIAKILVNNPYVGKENARLGTIMYMSPEQVRGIEIDFRSDIYSLGVTLFEMLTGKCPYDINKESDYIIQTKIINEPLPPAGTIYPAITRHMENVIAKATAKDPDKRFQSCDEFIEAIDSPYFISVNLSTDNINTKKQVKNIYAGKDADISQTKESRRNMGKRKPQKSGGELKSVKAETKIPVNKIEKTGKNNDKENRSKNNKKKKFIYYGIGLLILAALLIYGIIRINQPERIKIDETVNTDTVKTKSTDTLKTGNAK
jgi:serine/threonine protein kinase